MLPLSPGDQCKTEAVNGKSQYCHHEKFCSRCMTARFCCVCKILMVPVKALRGVALFGHQCTYSFLDTGSGSLTRGNSLWCKAF